VLLERLLSANELIPLKRNRGGELMLVWRDCKDVFSLGAHWSFVEQDLEAIFKSISIKFPKIQPKNGVPEVSSTETFLQKRFCKTVAGFEGFERTSRPFCNNSACLLFLSMRSSGCTIAGSGGGGGGSAVVGKGMGLAERKLDVCRRLHLDHLRASTARLSIANNDLLNAMFKSIDRR